MDYLNKLPVAIFLLASIAIVPVFNQPPFGGPPFGKPFPVPPANRPPVLNPNAFPKLPIKLPINIPQIPQHCDLKQRKAFKDPSIVETVAVGGPTSSPSQDTIRSAVNKAKSRGGPDGAVVEGFLGAARQIAQSKSRATIARAAGRAKRSIDRAFISETSTTPTCTSTEKLITKVRRGGQICVTIAPQQVLTWECRSNFCRGIPNAELFLQRYYCEAGNRVWTSWYVYCLGSQDIQLHSAEIAINCCCFKYSCNFTPYNAVSPLEF